MRRAGRSSSYGRAIEAVRLSGLEAARDAARAVLPVACGGCGLRDEALCAACGALLSGGGRWVACGASVGEHPLPVRALGPYAGATRSIVLGWKTQGRRDLEPRLVAALEREAHGWALDHPSPARDGVWVVPAPSGLTRRLDGRPSVLPLADAVARGIACGGSRADLVLALRRRGQGQRGRVARERVRRARSAVRARVLPPAGTRVVLVDDVMATGGTLEACRGVLEADGARVVAAFVIAASAGQAL